MNIESLMQGCNNYFYKWKETNTFTIENNAITVEGTYLPGQYIRIIGSVMNDGVYEVETVVDNVITVLGLTDEVFEGIIYGLSVPKSFTELENKIKEYNNKNVITNQTSESFNNFSKSVATNASGKPLQWQEIFKSNLDIYRQMYSGERWVMEI